jgi:hypothetical protein
VHDIADDGAALDRDLMPDVHPAGDAIGCVGRLGGATSYGLAALYCST